MKTLLRTLGKIMRWLFGGKPHLSSGQKQQLLQNWQQVSTLNDPTQQILEAEKVFTSMLRQLGYKGTFAEQWKRAENRFGKRPKVWKAHRLRNRIVHESNVTASAADAEFVLSSYFPIVSYVTK